MHSFSDSDAFIWRLLGKNAAVVQKERHSIGKSTGYAAGLSRIPHATINGVECKDQSILSGELIPQLTTTLRSYQEVIKNVFDRSALLFNPPRLISKLSKLHGKPNAFTARSLPENVTILPPRSGLGGYRKHSPNFPTWSWNRSTSRSWLSVNSQLPLKIVNTSWK